MMDSEGTASTVLAFPPQRADIPPGVCLPRPVQWELDRIDRWVEVTQHRLAQLEGATVAHHRAIRAIADELRAEILGPLDGLRGG